jgi:hypothetical protein
MGAPVQMDDAERRLLQYVVGPGSDTRLGFLNARHKELASVVWSLIGRRWAYLDTTQPEATNWAVRLTEAGRRAAKDESAFSPQLVERIRARCPRLSEEVAEHMVDAQACLENDLLRPATVMIGLAYEAAILAIGEALVTEGMLDPARFQKARRDGVAEVISLLAHSDVCERRGVARNDKHKVGRALDFAHQLRERRNDGGHTRPTYPFNDRAEIEEFLLSAARHLPELWRLAAGPA